MSRLDSLIRRLRAQQACLAYAAECIGTRPGPILELGLGNGRTYDHLRALFPGREIIVFERWPPTDPWIGPAEHTLILGDIVETLPAATARFAAGVPLIHSDIGSGDSEGNARIAAYLASRLPGLLMPGGLIVSDLLLPGIDDLALAPPADRYFVYRRG